MPVTRDMLLGELKELQRLTAFEQAVATVRRTQAASPAIAQELGANATRSGERLVLLAQAVRGAGGTPDIVGPVLGKLGALVQTQVNQVQTLQGALLGDLALEHQLRERARYARTLAVTLGEMSVLPVLDRLDLAHTETIAWLELRLGEVARTGSSALKATPVQAAVGSVRRVVGAPLTYAAYGVNRLGVLVGTLTRSSPAVAAQVKDTVGAVAERVSDEVGSRAETATATATAAASATAESTADVLSEAIDSTAAAVQRAERALEDPSATAEEVTHEVLEASGGDDVAGAKPPFAGYERLPGDSIMRHVDDTEDVDELRTLLAFEQAHKARKGVLKSAQARLTSLSAHA